MSDSSIENLVASSEKIITISASTNKVCNITSSELDSFAQETYKLIDDLKCVSNENKVCLKSKIKHLLLNATLLCANMENMKMLNNLLTDELKRNVSFLKCSTKQNTTSDDDSATLIDYDISFSSS